MNGEFIIIALVVAVSMLVLWIAKLTAFLRTFTETAGRLCCQMDCAGSYEEYGQLRRKLRCHYLTLIPFVDEKNVERVYRFFFHKSDLKSGGKKERKDGIAMMLMPSILGICICVVCVCGMTWAWYTASLEAPPQKLTAAYYKVTVTLTDAGDNEIPLTGDGYSLQAGTAYTVNLKAIGTATENGGYCLIQNKDGNAVFYTGYIKPPDGTLTITFTPTVEGIYTFTGVWGKRPDNVPANQIFGETEGTGTQAPTETPTADPTETPTADPNAIPLIGEMPSDPEPVSEPVSEPVPEPVSDPVSEPAEESQEENVYIVQDGDTLSAIAKKYGVTVEKLAAYNDITDVNTIHGNDVIRIPDPDWEIPAQE